MRVFIKKLPNFFQIETFEIGEYLCEETITNNIGLNYKNKNFHNTIFVSFVVKDPITNDKQSIYNWSYIDTKFSIEKFQQEIVYKCEKVLNPLPVQQGIYDLLLDRFIVQSLLKKIFRLISGSSVVNKSTCIAVGDHVFSNVDIIENPHGYFPQTVDNDGNLTVRKYLIKNGIIQTLLLNNKNASKLNMTPTGNSFDFGESVSNIEFHNLHPVNHNFSGIYITETLGVQFNEKNGNFSASIQGFLMENGQKVNSLMDGTVAFNIKDLKDLILQDDIIHSGPFACPSGILKNRKIGGL